MRLVVLDETIKRCKSGLRKSGSITGRVFDTMLEGHIYVAELLPISITECPEMPQRIGRWEIYEISKSTAPIGGEVVELFLSPDNNDLLVFYKGDRVEDVQMVNYKTNFSARIQGIVDCKLLAEKRVLIIGAGSVGSKIAMYLIRTGIGRLAIVDFDLVEAANLCRCEYFVEDIGRYKTFALRDRLLSVNPWVQVETYQQNMMEMEDDELIRLIERCDIVVSAADDAAAEQRLNAIAHSVVPVVYPALYSRASGGEVIFTVPGSSCYQCIVGSLRGISDAPSRGEWDYTTAGDLKAEPGLGIDIDYVVCIASKIALALLMSKVEDSDIARLIDSRRTVIFVSNQRQEMYGVPFEPFGTVWAETGINKDCIVCSEAPFSESENRTSPTPKAYGQAKKEDDDVLLYKVRDRVAKADAVDFPKITEFKI
jgi:molybdopterin/thiamine biosynthesis adenylyltransferase